MKLLFFPIFTIFLLPFNSFAQDKTPRVPDSTQVQTKADPAMEKAQKKADKITQGWPQSSVTAATEMIAKHGEPKEVTDDTLIWRKVAPFEKIVVNKKVYSSKFPVLHQNAVAHTVTYKVPVNKVEEVRKLSSDIMIDSTKGEMTASGDSESMNRLALNLAHDVITGKLTPEQARTRYGEETLNFMDGNKTAYTQTLNFGQQINTSEKGESITKKMNWEDDTSTKNKDMKESQEENPIKQDEVDNDK